MLRKTLVKCFMTLLKSFFPFIFWLNSNRGNIFSLTKCVPSDSINIPSFSSSEVHCFAKLQRKVY